MVVSEYADLFTALSKFQGEMPPVPKTASNPFFNSRYADLADIVKLAAPLLAKHGLAVVQLPCQNEHGPALRTIIGHTSGQYLEAEADLTPTKADPQGVGSAMTYMRRYAYCAALGIVADEDDDGNAATAIGAAERPPPVPRDRGEHGRREAPPERPPLAPKTPPRDNSKTEKMRKRIYAVSNGLGMTVQDAIVGALGVPFGEEPDEADLTFEQCRAINDWLSAELERGA